MRDGLGASWDPSALGWDLSASVAPRVWSVISKRWGMRWVCVDCLQDACAYVTRLRAHRQRRSAEINERFFRTADLQRYQQPETSTSTEIEIRPADTAGESRPDRLETAAAVLGLEWPVERDEIVRAFRRTALRCHPDCGGTDAAMLEALAARDVLLG